MPSAPPRRHAHAAPALMRPEPVPLGQRLLANGQEICALLGIGDDALAALRDAGLPHILVGRDRRYPVDAVRVWLTQRATAAQPPV